MTFTRARLVGLAGVFLSAFAPAAVLCSWGLPQEAPQTDRRVQVHDQAADSDPEHLRAIARDLLARQTDAKSVDAASQLLQRAAEIENQRAQAAKSAAELDKLRDDLAYAESSRSSESWKSSLTILAPLFTTVVLAGTLVVQSYQFKKQRDAAAEEAEDKRWGDAMKVVAERQELSPIGTLLATFRHSRRYGVPARDLAVQQLAKSNSLDEFSSCLDFFENWSDFKLMIKTDRSIAETYRRLDNKTLVKGTGEWDMNLLNEEERTKRELANEQVQILSVKVGALLKTPRPDLLKTLDLSAASFWRCDWKGVDLSGADLTSFYLDAVDLDGADFSGVTQFQYSKFDRCAWWTAGKISAPFLDHLAATCPYTATGSGYGSGYRPVPQADYEACLQKLKQASSIV